MRLPITNLHPISHRFQVADYWSNPLCNTVVRGDALHSGLRNFTRRNRKHRFIVLCEKCFDIMNRLGVGRECDGRTDGQTDVLTDGRGDPALNS